MQNELFLTIKMRISGVFYARSVIENAAIDKAEVHSTDAVDALVPGDYPHTLMWEDIDYSDQSRSGWKATLHYVRMLESLQKNGVERLQSDQTYQEKMVAALRYWIRHDFTNPNWWHNDIGMPRNIGTLTLLLWDYMPKSLQEEAVKLIARGSMKTRSDITRWTGANLIWGIVDTLYHAVLTEDEEVLAMARNRTLLEFGIQTGNREGLKPDASFWQHGPRLYSGGYGQSFLIDISRLVYYLQGTAYAVPSQFLARLNYFVVDGLRLMSYKKGVDYQIIGREIARKETHSTYRIMEAVRRLRQIEEMPGKEQLLQYERELSGAAVPIPRLKHFPYVSMMSRVSETAYMSVKCLSSSQFDAEICNGEGELCYNMSYGTHICLLRDGDEYSEISPVWNYARIPGTTARDENDAQLLSHRNWWCLPLPNPISGGLQEGEYGVIYECAQHDGIRVYASYFFIPGRMIMLGAGITDEQNQTLFTTLNQCRQKGVIYQQADGAVVHNGFCYQSLDSDVPLVFEAKEQTGSWHRNNVEYADEYASASIVTIGAKCQPSEHDAYAFVISDEKSEKQESFVILCNTKERQAIRLEDGRTMEVLYTDNGGISLIY